LIETLLFALSLKRPHGGRGVEKLARHIEALFPGEVRRDAVGNLHLDRRRDASHRTLFVAHIDTVHRRDGRNVVDGSESGWIKAANGQPLGADDGAGVALLCHLAKAGVAAYYVFTQGEECGGIGARHLASKHRDLLKQFDRAIAFDRKGTFSVISHQATGRCCSDEFAEALSSGLSNDWLIYGPDETGVYTDTAEFVSCIPECTNVSVGYYNEHGPHERLDVHHLQALAVAAVALQWDALPVARKAGDVLDLFDVRKRKGSKVARFTPDDDLYDALDEAWAVGKSARLARIIAKRAGDEGFAVLRELETQHFDTELLCEAFDNLEAYGPEATVDMMLGDLYGGKQ
jgi:hypothetical protein